MHEARATKDVEAVGAKLQTDLIDASSDLEGLIPFKMWLTPLAWILLKSVSSEWYPLRSEFFVACFKMSVSCSGTVHGRRQAAKKSGQRSTAKISCTARLKICRTCCGGS